MCAKTRKRKSGPRKKPKKFLLVFFWIVVFLAVVAAAVAYFYYNGNHSQTKTKSVSASKNTKKAAQKRTFEMENRLEGSWVSSADGRILEIRGHRFTLELPSVSDHEITRGTIDVKGNTVSVLYTDTRDKCAVHPGIYTVEITKESLRFIVKNDICARRRQIFATTWHKF